MEAGHSSDRLLANQLENRGAELQIADLEPGGRRLVEVVPEAKVLGVKVDGMLQIGDL